MGSPKSQYGTPDDAPARPPAVPPMYIDLDTLENSEGLIAIISQRRSNGVITFAMFKSFQRDGKERTSFISETLRPSYLELQKLAFERIDAIKSDPELLASLQKRAGFEPAPRRGRP